MPPYEITYKLGKYESSLIIQAPDEREARFRAVEAGLIPQGATITSVELREVS